MPTGTNDDPAAEAAAAEQLVADISTVASLEALHELGNQLIGVLYSREQAEPEPDRAAALRDERRAVEARVDATSPAADDVDEILERWGARLRALRDQ
jgi:phage-related minor tail protein